MRPPARPRGFGDHTDAPWRGLALARCDPSTGRSSRDGPAFSITGRCLAARWSLLGSRQLAESPHSTPLLEPLADDLREWFLASGRPAGDAPVFPTRPGNFWNKSGWANWRRRVWQGEPERRYERRTRRATTGCAPAGTRPRDLRSSFITIQVYAGVPLTTIAKRCGTGVTMIEKHYAGVIENWDGEQIPPERQITAAREQVGHRHAE